MKLTRSILTVLVPSLLLVACGGDDPMQPETTRVIKDNPSFANDVMEIFNRRGCTAGNCHGGGQGGLTLTSAATSYSNLVNVASPNSGEIRVIPNNANDSYLVKKLEGRQSVGQRMPIGGGALDNIDLSNIKNWINQGAQNN